MTSRWLALLYLLFALPLVSVLAWWMPPFEGPDEDNHFLRAVQVAQFGIAADRQSDGSIGGLLPRGATSLAHGFNDWHFLPHVRVDPARMAIAEATGWGALEQAGFANTAIYPPVFYIPAAAAIGVAYRSGLPVLTGLRMARLANGLCAVAIAALSIDLAASGSLFLFWLLSLPMTISLCASCSQDALVIACSALSAALLSRIAGLRAFSSAAIIAALLLGCLGAARPPYLALAPLPAIWAAGSKRGAARLALCLLPLLIGIGWLRFGAAPVLVPNQMAAQLAFLAAHPFAPVHIAVATLQRDGWQLTRAFIGVLGWLDIPLPHLYYPLCLMVLAAVLLTEVGRPEARVRARPLHAVLIAACCAAIFASLYLDWTPVGAGVVEGVQGRYFIPVAAFIAPLLGRNRPTPKIFRLMACLFASASALALLVAVRSHFSLA